MGILHTKHSCIWVCLWQVYEASFPSHFYFLCTVLAVSSSLAPSPLSYSILEAQGDLLHLYIPLWLHGSDYLTRLKLNKQSIIFPYFCVYSHLSFVLAVCVLCVDDDMWYHEGSFEAKLKSRPWPPHEQRRLALGCYLMLAGGSAGLTLTGCNYGVKWYTCRVPVPSIHPETCATAALLFGSHPHHHNHNTGEELDANLTDMLRPMQQVSDVCKFISQH